jgi:hypothetical protein
MDDYKNIIFRRVPFRSVPNLGMGYFEKTVPSLFREFFRNGISIATLIQIQHLSEIVWSLDLSFYSIANSFILLWVNGQYVRVYCAFSGIVYWLIWLREAPPPPRLLWRAVQCALGCSDFDFFSHFEV